MPSAKSFDARMERIFTATGVKSDAALAKILEIRPPSVASAKKRQQLPGMWIEKIAEKYGVSAHWLLFGERENSAAIDGTGTANDLTLEAKVVELEAKNIALEAENASLKEARAAKDELLQAKEETLAAYRQLLNQTQDALAASRKGRVQVTDAPAFVASAPLTDQTNKD